MVAGPLAPPPMPAADEGHSSDCDCAGRMDRALEPHNMRLERVVVLAGLTFVSRLAVGAQKIDTAKRKSIPVVVASHCPFCGQKFSEGPV